MSKKKKQWLLLGTLLIVIAVMITVYQLIPEQPAEEEKTAVTEQNIQVAGFTADSVQKIDIKTDSVQSTLNKENGIWVWLQKKGVPINTETIDTFLKEAESVKASDEFDYNEELLADYGLAAPGLIVTLTGTDGKETVFRLGAEVPSVGGHYGTVSSNPDKIYCLSQSFYEAFRIDELKLYQKDIPPQINEAYVTGIHVNKTSLGEPFEAKEVSEKERVESYSAWNITKPYKAAAAFNPDKISEMQSTCSSVKLGDLVEYKAKSLKKYGFGKDEKTVRIDYFELKEGASESTQKDKNGKETPFVKESDRVKKNLTLYIGELVGDENYYVHLGNSENVYLMSKGDVNGFIEPEVFEYADHSIYAVLATDIKGYDVTIGKTKIHVTREKKDDKNIWYVNGKKVSDEEEEAVLTPYSALFLLEFSGVIKPEEEPTGNQPVIEVVYHEEKRDVTIQYLPYDEINFYRVERDGKQIFLTNKRAVDDVVDKFRDMNNHFK